MRKNSERPGQNLKNCIQSVVSVERNRQVGQVQILDSYEIGKERLGQDVSYASSLRKTNRASFLSLIFSSKTGMSRTL